MADHQVIIFGSFTDKEIRSLQCQSLKENPKIKFGSLDVKSLKSVGILTPKETDLQPEKACELSNLPSRPSVSPLSSSSETPTNYKDVFSGKISFESSESSVESGTKEPDLRHVEKQLPVRSGSTSNLPIRIALNNSSIFSSLSEYDVLTNSSNGILREATKESAVNESILPNALARNFTPRGLINLGNLCFLNATLQALLSCCPFFDLLQELRYCNIAENGYPTLHAFVEFISFFDMVPVPTFKDKVIVETASPFRPVMFDSILKNFTPDIPDNLSGRPRQEDAQEFLSFVMHQMHDELLKLDGRISNGNGKTASLVSSTDDESEEDEWETVGSRKKTAITRTQSFLPSKLSAIFGGQLRSVVKARGSKPSATIQPFLLLHINILPDPVCSIEDALQWFSAPELLEGYQPSAPGKAEIVSARKSVKILEPPEIMILHLMRFSYGTQGSTKLHKPVSFPLELVIGRDLLSTRPSEMRLYELVATITHHGRDPSKGHYTADARHPIRGWLHYDDASVTGISETKVLQDQAYVLFYKRL